MFRIKPGKCLIGHQVCRGPLGFQAPGLDGGPDHFMQWRWHVQLLFHKTRKAAVAQRQSALSGCSIFLLKREIVGQ